MKRTLGFRRALAMIALGGATFALFGSTFGPWGGGCNFATFQNYDDMFGASGEAAIRTVSSNFFRFGTDWDTVVRIPTTNFAVDVWNNWLDNRIPDDLPNKTVVLR